MSFVYGNISAQRDDGPPAHNFGGTWSLRQSNGFVVNMNSGGEITGTATANARNGVSTGTVTGGPGGQLARPGQPSGIDVKVTRNGKPLAAFQSASDNTGVEALLMGEDLSIDLTSPDQQWILSISVSGAKTGVYRLAGLREEGKAMILLTGGEEAMMVRASTGELKLSEASESYCSGSFTGTGTDATGNEYTYEGKFSRVRARRHE